MVELEQSIIPTLSKIAFLALLLICNKDLVNATVYHKKTNLYIYTLIYTLTGSLLLQTMGNLEHLKP